MESSAAPRCQNRAFTIIYKSTGEQYTPMQTDRLKWWERARSVHELPSHIEASFKNEWRSWQQKCAQQSTATHKQKRQITNTTKIRERATQTCTKTLSQNSHKYATYGHKGKGSYRRPHTHSLNALVKRKSPRVSQIHECRTIVPGVSTKRVAP